MSQDFDSARVPPELLPLFAKAERFVREYFDTLRRTPQRGEIDIAGQRYVLVRARSLSVEFFDVIEQLFGGDASHAYEVAYELLFDLAHAMGLSDARDFATRIDDDDPIARMSMGPIHFAHAGWAFVDIHAESQPTADDDFVLFYDHPHSFEADAWLSAERRPPAPACVMSAGYSSGWCESSFGLTLVAVEMSCRAQGDDHCRFVMAPPERIEERVQQFLARDGSGFSRTPKIVYPGSIARRTAADAINSRAEELRRQNEALERRVAARTAELTRANEALQRELRERHAAEGALREVQELNQRVLEAVPSGIVHVAADGAIQVANAEASRILGLSFDELTQRYAADFETETIHEDGTPAPLEDYPVTRALLTGQPQPPETLGVRRPDGEIAWAIFRAFPLFTDDGSTVRGAVVTFVDITERIRAEAQRLRLEEDIQRTQRLESLGVLAGGVAHDFNNLLVGVLGNASWLQSHLPEDSREREVARQIETAGKRAASLTQQLLAYSGRRRLEPELVDISATARETLELVRTSIPRRARVETHLEEGLPRIRGDASQIRQVIMNLITNAAEALGRERGTIRIETYVSDLDASQLASRKEASGAAPGSYVCLRVADDGCGMPDDLVPRIFDPFYTTKAGGHGLGLAATLGIVRAHAGALDIETAPNVGTSFEVCFPRASSDEISGDEADATQPSDGSRMGHGDVGVLVVDDDPGVRLMVQSALESLGTTVWVAENGESALSLFAQHAGSIDAAVVDLTMPGMDGLAVARALRERAPALPILLSSGFDRDSALESGEDSSDLAFLSKPFTFEELRRALRVLLTSSD